MDHGRNVCRLAFLERACTESLDSTTFFSVVFAIFNSLRMQGSSCFDFAIEYLSAIEFVARKISNYLTKETGWTVVFESAIVPKWKDGQISFKKTYISRHPDFAPTSSRTSTSASVSTSHPAHAAATRLDAHHPTFHHPGEDDTENLNIVPAVQTYDNIEELSPEQRITTFDLEVDSVDVQLSLTRWLDGKGLVQNAVVKGVRGVVGGSISTLQIALY
jgi:distribution and morphology protein 31